MARFKTLELLIEEKKTYEEQRQGRPHRKTTENNSPLQDFT
jgi:hypothetical protein